MVLSCVLHYRMWWGEFVKPCNNQRLQSWWLMGGAGKGREEEAASAGRVQGFANFLDLFGRNVFKIPSPNGAFQDGWAVYN